MDKRLADSPIMMGCRQCPPNSRRRLTKEVKVEKSVRLIELAITNCVKSGSSMPFLVR